MSTLTTDAPAEDHVKTAQDALCSSDAALVRDLVAALLSSCAQPQQWQKLCSLLCTNTLLALSMPMADREALVNTIRATVTAPPCVAVAVECLGILQALLVTWPLGGSNSPLPLTVVSNLSAVVPTAVCLSLVPGGAALRVSTNLLHAVVAVSLACAAMAPESGWPVRLLSGVAHQLAVVITDRATCTAGKRSTDECDVLDTALSTLAVTLAALPPASEKPESSSSSDTRIADVSVGFRDLCHALVDLGSALVKEVEVATLSREVVVSVVGGAYSLVRYASANSDSETATCNSQCLAALATQLKELLSDDGRNNETDPQQSSGEPPAWRNMVSAWCAPAGSEESPATRLSKAAAQLAIVESAAAMDEAVSAVSAAQEDIDKRYGGGTAVSRAILLTPGIVWQLTALLVRRGSASAPPGAALDLWLPLVQPESPTTVSSAPGCNPGTSAIRVYSGSVLIAEASALFTTVFVLSGGARGLCDYLAVTLPVTERIDETEEEKRATAVQQQVRLLSAWHLLEAVSGSCGTACMTVAFRDMVGVAVAGFISSTVSLAAAEVRILLSTPSSVLMLMRALALIGSLPHRCAACCDGATRAALDEGATVESAVAEYLFPDEELVRQVATVVSAAAAAGAVEAVVAGLDALTALARAHPYAATVAVDFDFLSESLELWKVADEERRAAAEKNASSSAEGKDPTTGSDTCDARSNSLTVRDCLTLGTLRVMAALVPRVPPAVNFEWIELLGSAILLLPFHRKAPVADTASGAVTLRDAYAEALLPCVLASARANQDSREYLFESPTQCILAQELEARNREVAHGGVRGLAVNSSLVTTILALAALFPTAPVAEFVRAVESLLPPDGTPWYDLSVPSALLVYMAVAADAVADVEETGGDGGEERGGAEVEGAGVVQPLFSDDFVARAVDALVGVANPLAGSRDPTTRKLLETLHKRAAICGTATIATYLRRWTPAPRGDELRRAVPRLALAAASIQGWALPRDDSGGLFATLSGCAARAFAPFAAAEHVADELLSPDYILYCHQLLLCLVPVAQSSCAASNCDAWRTLTVTMSGEQPSFLLALSCAYQRLAALDSSTPAAAMAPSLCCGILSTVEVVTAHTAADESTWRMVVLPSEGWKAFTFGVLLPRIAEPAVASTLMVLLNYPEVRGYFAKVNADQYQQALATLKASAEAGSTSLRLQLYMKELSS